MGESRLKELVWEVSQELSKQSELLHRKRQELEEQKQESDAPRATLMVDQDAAKALIDLQRRTFETEMKKQREEVGMELDTQRQNATKEITAKKKDCEEELVNQRQKAVHDRNMLWEQSDKDIAVLRSNWETERLKQETELILNWSALKKKERNFEAECVKATHVLSLNQVILNLKVLCFFF